MIGTARRRGCLLLTRLPLPTNCVARFNAAVEVVVDCTVATPSSLEVDTNCSNSSLALVSDTSGETTLNFTFEVLSPRHRNDVFVRSVGGVVQQQ